MSGLSTEDDGKRDLESDGDEMVTVENGAGSSVEVDVGVVDIVTT